MYVVKPCIPLSYTHQTAALPADPAPWMVSATNTHELLAASSAPFCWFTWLGQHFPYEAGVLFRYLSLAV